jgi:hypothetical protein
MYTEEVYVSTKKRNLLEEMYYATPVLPTFGTGRVAEILDIPMWRLQKFLDGKQYRLSPEDSLGAGRGSRRVFTVEDIYRLAIASRLVQDGFAASFIGEMLVQLDDRDFGDRIDSDGKDRPLTGLAFRRAPKGPELVLLFKSLGEIRFSGDAALYYVLDLVLLANDVNLRLSKMSSRPL